MVPGGAQGPSPREADVVLLGGGGAAVIVLQHLAAAVAQRLPADGDGASRAGHRPLRVVVVDPVDRLASRPADRTWCSWWDAADPLLAGLAPSVTASWRRLTVVDASGAPQVLDLGPLRYVMVRSEDLYAQVAGRLAAVGALVEVSHVAASVSSVVTGPSGVVVATPAGDVVAQVALDSRPARPVRPAATALLQHFQGEVVLEDEGAGQGAGGGTGAGTGTGTGAAGGPAGAPAVLMDFTLPQPPVGLAFGYRLPAPGGATLVEYTEFSPAVLEDEGYAAALGSYREACGLAGAPTVHREQGAIPMDDAVRAPTAGPRVVRLGGAGGAVRGSTGYAFAAMQRQGHAVAAAIVAEHAGGRPLLAATVAPPRPYPRRHAWMDSLLLRALADGSLRGADFFPRLFARNPASRVLRFLDGSTTVAEEVALMATSPLRVMTVALLRDALWRIRSARAAPRGTGSRRTRRRRRWRGR